MQFIRNHGGQQFCTLIFLTGNKADFNAFLTYLPVSFFCCHIISLHICPLFQGLEVMIHVYDSRISRFLNVLPRTVLDKAEKFDELRFDLFFIFSFCIEKNDLSLISKQKIRNFFAGLPKCIAIFACVKEIKF